MKTLLQHELSSTANYLSIVVTHEWSIAIDDHSIAIFTNIWELYVENNNLIQ